MNWVGDLIQENIEETDTVLDLGCGIMQATLDIVPSYPKTILKCKKLFGVDIHQPYLDYLNDYGIETLKWDLRKVPYPFQDKSFDIVILTDILEHLENMEYVNKLIRESMRIARKKVIVLTPNKFSSNIKAIKNPYPYDQFKENNKYQRHHLLISRKYLEENGFKVKRIRIQFFAIRKLVNKILHVWDVAGVSSIMCKYQNKLGYNSKLYIRNDPYKYSDIYGNNVIGLYNPKTFLTNKKYLNSIKNTKVYLIIKKIINQINFTLQLKKVIDDIEPDIIHFNQLNYIVIIFKLLGYKLLIEFHGTKLRKRYVDKTVNTNRKIFSWMFRLYQILGIPVFVSTPDLLKDVPNYVKPKKISKLISNPVDKDIFNNSIHRPISEVALYCLNKYDVKNMDIAIHRAKERGYKIVIHNRIKGVIFEHLVFANYLASFECFIDRIRIGSLSKTALEALSTGLKVIDWKNDLIEELPYEHEPNNVAKLTVYIYDKILVGKI